MRLTIYSRVMPFLVLTINGLLFSGKNKCWRCRDVTPMDVAFVRPQTPFSHVANFEQEFDVAFDILMIFNNRIFKRSPLFGLPEDGVISGVWSSICHFHFQNRSAQKWSVRKLFYDEKCRRVSGLQFLHWVEPKSLFPQQTGENWEKIVCANWLLNYSQ